MMLKKVMVVRNIRYININSEINTKNYLKNYLSFSLIFI